MHCVDKRIIPVSEWNGEGLYLGGGVKLRDPRERGVEALHRLLAPLPLAGAVLGAVAQGRGLLEQGIYQWNENYADRITQIEPESFCIVSRKMDIYLCRICCRAPDRRNPRVRLPQKEQVVKLK